MTNRRDDIQPQRARGPYLEAGDLFQVWHALLDDIESLIARLAEFQRFTTPDAWILALDDDDITYVQPIGHPALGEAMRFLLIDEQR